ncbi:MAG: hypothetical protein ACTHK4_12310 [Mycobacteriales bacterium]
MGRPLLLLEVEGVLHPFGVDQQLPGFVPHGLFPGEEIVLINPQHGIWIDELAMSYDIVWVTGWDDDANGLFAPLLNLDPGAMVTLPGSPSAKLGLIGNLVRGRAMCWMDSDHDEATRNWAAAREEPTLLLTTSPAAGLTSDQVDAALDWARSDSLRGKVSVSR